MLAEGWALEASPLAFLSACQCLASKAIDFSAPVLALRDVGVRYRWRRSQWGEAI